jgi:MFS family permease
MARLTATLDRDAKIIGLVCFPHMMSHFYYTTLPPMFGVLMVAFAKDEFEIAAVVTAFALAAAISQTPVGFLVDRASGRLVLIGGLAVEACAIGAMGLANAYWQLVVLGVIAGLGHTVFHPANYAIMSTSISEHRMGRAFGVHAFTGFLGYALAPIFMTGIAALWHWKAAFLLAGAIGLAGALLLWINGDLISDRPAPASAEPGSLKQDEQPAGESVVGGMRLLLSVPVMMCFLYFVFQQFGFGGVRNFLVVGLDDLYGVPVVVGGAALSCLMVGTAGGVLAGGMLADRIGPQVATAFCTLAPGGILIALIGVYDMPSIVLFTVVTLAGFLLGLLIPSRDLLLRSVTPKGSMGKVMGFASTGGNFGGAIIPLVLGYVMVHHDTRLVFWIPAFFVAAAFLTFITVRSRYGEK